VIEYVSVKVGFPGGRKVSARVGEHVVFTDQPRSKGGRGEAPSPYSLFLASISTCIGYYALAFCLSRDMPTEGLAVEGVFRSENGTLVGAEFRIRPPHGFPEKYRDALLRSVDRCSVKRSILARPDVRIQLEPAVEEVSYFA